MCEVSLGVESELGWRNKWKLGLCIYRAVYHKNDFKKCDKNFVSLLL